MSRLRLAVLGPIAASILACVGPCKGNKVPKPWSKTEGQEVVVGGPSAQELAAAGMAEPLPPGTDPGKLVQDPQITRLGPKVDGDLSPVEESYDELYEVGNIEVCPEGTELMDKREDRRNARLYCALPDNIRHGPWMSFYGDGKVREIAPYVGGMRHGQVTAWKKDGTKESTFTWVDGNPTTGTTF